MTVFKNIFFASVAKVAKFPLTLFSFSISIPCDAQYHLDIIPILISFFSRCFFHYLMYILYIYIFRSDSIIINIIFCIFNYLYIELFI